MIVVPPSEVGQMSTRRAGKERLVLVGKKRSWQNEEKAEQSVGRDWVD